MRFVCGENRMEHAVVITKNAAQACDTGVGQGTQRPRKSKINAALGRRPLFNLTLSRAGIFPACGIRFSEQMSRIA
jgi:hypothetical protein